MCVRVSACVWCAQVCGVCVRFCVRARALACAHARTCAHVRPRARACTSARYAQMVYAVRTCVRACVCLRAGGCGSLLAIVCWVPTKTHQILLEVHVSGKELPELQRERKMRRHCTLHHVEQLPNTQSHVFGVGSSSARLGGARRSPWQRRRGNPNQPLCQQRPAIATKREHAGSVHSAAGARSHTDGANTGSQPDSLRRAAWTDWRRASDHTSPSINPTIQARRHSARAEALPPRAGGG